MPVCMWNGHAHIDAPRLPIFGATRIGNELMKTDGDGRITTRRDAIVIYKCS